MTVPTHIEALQGAGRFSRATIATPNRLATSAGQEVLAAGGNAVDAAVTAGFVLSVVTPYHCGLGGDVLALVWDGSAHGLMSVGAAPAAASAEQVRAALGARSSDGKDARATMPGAGGMPDRGALTVTVPGAVAGWLALLERFGTWTPARAIAPALHLADEGFVVSTYAARAVRAARSRLGDEPGWEATFGKMTEGERFVQPALARTLRALRADGSAALYSGPIAETIARTLAAHGSAMSEQDLAAHEVEWVAPLAGGYRGLSVLELPPPSQGVSALTALGILDALGPLPTDLVEATHLQVEAVRAAMADRDQHVGDPAAMHVTPEQLLASNRIAAIASTVDRQRASAWPMARPTPGGTAYLCAADGDGLLVSLIQSNFHGFGSGVVIESAGFGLHDRGSNLSLDTDAVNALRPGQRPMHTLIPALVLEDGLPRYIMGTMGGDAQPQVHVQLLGHLVDRGSGLADALAAPRFVVNVADGSVAIEPGTDPTVERGLTARGHAVTTLPDVGFAGHAHLVAVSPTGYDAASDPRCDGAVGGV